MKLISPACHFDCFLTFCLSNSFIAAWGLTQVNLYSCRREGRRAAARRRRRRAGVGVGEGQGGGRRGRCRQRGPFITQRPSRVLHQTYPPLLQPFEKFAQVGNSKIMDDMFADGVRNSGERTS